MPKGATSTNVDLFSREENIKQYPELDASEIVITDVIDDGFVLSTIPESSQDFIIANHVLEHSQNPLQALINWADKIRPNGILFLTVPIAAKCFDRGRALTTLQHLVDDFNLCKRGELNQFHERNKQHFIEYIHISEPNIHSERYDDYVMPSASELEKRIGETRMENCNIHFHTFSADSFWNLVSFLSTQVYKALSVETVEKNRAEIIAILRKS